MTIREYCAHRACFARRVAIALGVAFMVICSAYDVIARVNINTWYVAGAAALLVLAALSAGLRSIKCPRCGMSLRKVAANEMTPTLPKLDAFPRCRVSLDEPMAMPTDAKAPAYRPCKAWS
jgi:hypothetical protein